MDARAFVKELAALRDERLRALSGAGSESLGGGEQARGAGAHARGGDAEAHAGDLTALLKVALANEISVSELAAAWMPGTPEVDIKIALARQAGDEARHFQLVAGRLEALGFDPREFTPPGPNALFEYLRALPTSVERVAAGLFTLESIAYRVNERFMQLCALRGDQETVRLYREFIQPDEEAHRDLGASLLERYATDAERQARARAAVLKTIEIAGIVRARAAERLGASCLPGC